MAGSPTQRSLAYLREQGFECELVTHWNHFSKRRVDLLGFADILAFRIDAPEVLLVQSTDSTSHTHRRAKILASERAQKWLSCGDKHFLRGIVLHSWGLRGGRGTRKVYQLRTEYFSLDQFRGNNGPSMPKL